MAVGIVVGGREYPIGSGSFFGAFFSTVCVRLESERWGARFPVVMNRLYSGHLAAGEAEAALSELDLIQQGLEAFPPSDLVWDFRDRSARPPWGDRISPDITSLGNYFVTSDGKDLFEVLRAALHQAATENQPARIE